MNQRNTGERIMIQGWRHVYYALAAVVGQLLDVQDVFIEQVADRLAACHRPEMQRRW